MDREKSSGQTHFIHYLRSHAQNLRSTPGQAEPLAQYFYKISTTSFSKQGQWQSQFNNMCWICRNVLKSKLPVLQNVQNNMIF